MYTKLLKDTSFYHLLLEIDKEIAATSQRIGCPFCGGKLDSAPYRRKPRGIPEGMEGMSDEITVRFSFCCRLEGCRKRQTPDSVRFAGRKVWLAALIAVLSVSSSPVSVRNFANSLGITTKTLQRWRTWWNEKFVLSVFWRSAKARFSPPVDQENLPSSILSRFSKKDSLPSEELVSCLQFLSPGWCFAQVI